MKMRKIYLFTILFVILGYSSFATTWNEPWHDEVIKNADSFVFARINSFDERTGLDITIIRTISGNPIIGSINISSFYLLKITSFSIKDFFEYFASNEAFFFIKQEINGNYSIATPTTGFAKVENGMVHATYRHSYHQALVPIDIYEETIKAIFNNYHNQPYDNVYINEYIRKHLSRGPVNINTSSDLFFLQHVALECIFHLRLSGYYSEIIPFLNSSQNVHDQISAIRALRAYNTDDCKDELIKIINARGRNNFIQVMSIWTLAEFKPIELKDKLMELLENASTENNGFGGNLMDPRVGTYIPSVKIALQNLIDLL